VLLDGVDEEESCSLDRLILANAAEASATCQISDPAGQSSEQKDEQANMDAGY